MPIYMTCDKLKGDVTAAGFEKSIDLMSVQFGVGIAVGSPKGGSKNRTDSTASFSEISCAKMIDDASPVLFKSVAEGANVGEVKLRYVIGTGADGKADNEYLTITLTDCIVSSFSSSSGGDRPTESFSLNFVTINYKYMTQQKDGSLKAEAPEFSWDLEKNTGK